MYLKNRQKSEGFTLVELLITVAIVGILQAVGMASYTSYLERVDIAQAVLDMNAISKRLYAYQQETGEFPATLSQVNAEMTDPWGNSYVYVEFSGIKGNAGKRKDKNLVPINSDYDLFSKGKDGESMAPLTAPKSKDDVIRANNGGYMGLAANY